MELHYSVTEKDYIDFNLNHYKNSKYMQRTLKSILVLGPILILLLTITIFLESNNWLFIAILTILFSTLWILTFSRFFPKIIEKSIKRQFLEGKSNEFLGERVFTLLENSFKSMDDTITTETKYSKFVKILYDSNRFYIYIGTLTAFIVPFSAFESEEQKTHFFIC